MSVCRVEDATNSLFKHQITVNGYVKRFVVCYACAYSQQSFEKLGVKCLIVWYQPGEMADIASLMILLVKLRNSNLKACTIK